MNMTDFDHQAFNERLKKAREHRGLSQTEAGQQIGVSQTAWRGYEKGLYMISLDKLAYWAKLNKIRIDWLIYGRCYSRKKEENKDEQLS